MNNKIKTAGLNIDDKYHFAKDSDKLSIRDKKINFIYANNGSGKTTFSQYINNKYDDFILLDIKSDLWLTDSNKILISKNIREIKRIEKEIDDKCSYFSKIIKSIIENYDYSSGKSFVKNFIKPFYDTEGIYLSKKYLIKSKNDLKNYQLKYEELSFIQNELIEKINPKIDVNVNFEISKFESYKFEDVKELYCEITKKINELKEIIKKEVIEEFEKKNIDRFVLENIYKEINKLDSMDNCYICNNEIKNFEEIKSHMKQRIDELLNEYSGISELEKFLKQWDGLFNTNTFKYYRDNYWIEVFDLIEKTFSDFKNWLKMFLYDVSKKINDNKDEWNKICSLNKKIDQLEKEKTLKKLKQEDFDLIKDIIDSIVGKGRINFNYDSKQLISIDTVDKELPFSTGEKTIISLIFNLVYFFSTDNTNDKIYIIDDVENSLDYLNIINFSHIIKTFFYDYHLNFLICTHNPQLIKQMWDSGMKEISIYTLFKNFKGERKLKIYEDNNSDGSIDFIGIGSGIKILCKIVQDNWKSFSVEEKSIFFIYICWMYRWHELIYEESKYNNIIDFLKFNNLFDSLDDNEFKNKFDSIFKIINEFYVLDNYNFSYKEFKNEIKRWKTDINNIQIKFEKIPLLIKKNIENLVKIFIAREFLRFNISKLCLANNIELKDKMEIRKDLYKLQNERIIDNYTRKKILYIWSFLNTFCHNENLSSLLLNGIELNDQITHQIINDLKCIFNNGDFQND